VGDSTRLRSIGWSPGDLEASLLAYAGRLMASADSRQQKR